MKDLFGVIGPSLFILGCAIIISLAAYNIGHCVGQEEAFNGKYNYEYQTNITYQGNTVTTNCNWVKKL